MSPGILFNNINENFNLFNRSLFDSNISWLFFGPSEFENNIFSKNKQTMARTGFEITSANKAKKNSYLNNERNLSISNYGASSLDFTQNYFGTTDSVKIQKSIFDFLSKCNKTIESTPPETANNNLED